MRIFIVLAVVLIFIVASVVFVIKWKPDLDKSYWRAAAMAGVSVWILLSLLVMVQLPIYVGVLLFFALGTREVSKYMFSSSRGGYAFGIYLGMLASLPFGVSQFAT